ncbi:hypothetical protein ABKN59_008401 [Abortiporus biennis]
MIPRLFLGILNFHSHLSLIMSQEYCFAAHCLPTISAICVHVNCSHIEEELATAACHCRPGHSYPSNVDLTFNIITDPSKEIVLRR